MAEALHRAIRDALRDAPGYRAKGILLTVILEATTSLDVDESLLYRAIYTIFRAMPERLVPGTTLGITTADVQDGVELAWEAKEQIVEGPGDSPSRGILGVGPHGDLVDIAVLALERFCSMRAGYVETQRARVGSSTSFDRPAHIVRRVQAFIPIAGPRPPPIAPGLPQRPAAPSAPGLVARPDELRGDDGSWRSVRIGTPASN